MTRLLVLVEGQTEESFINRVLAPHLAARGIFAIPTILETRHLPGRARDKGGVTSWAKVERDLRRLLADSEAWTTTVMDFYGLPDDFPGVKAGSQGRLADPVRDAAAIELQLKTALGAPRRFVPFLALHELEAWVFTDPEAVANHFGEPGLAKELTTVVSEFPSVEHINHGSDTHPSRRLEAMIARYKKRSDGPMPLEQIGIERIRAACPHFSGWVSELEAIAP